jgi:hypothetical protein
MRRSGQIHALRVSTPEKESCNPRSDGSARSTLPLYPTFRGDFHSPSSTPRWANKSLEKNTLHASCQLLGCASSCPAALRASLSFGVRQIQKAVRENEVVRGSTKIRSHRPRFVFRLHFASLATSSGSQSSPPDCPSSDYKTRLPPEPLFRLSKVRQRHSIAGGSESALI